MKLADYDHRSLSEIKHLNPGEEDVRVFLIPASIVFSQDKQNALKDAAVSAARGIQPIIGGKLHEALQALDKGMK